MAAPRREYGEHERSYRKANDHDHILAGLARSVRKGVELSGRFVRKDHLNLKKQFFLRIVHASAVARSIEEDFFARSDTFSY